MEDNTTGASTDARSAEASRHLDAAEFRKRLEFKRDYYYSRISRNMPRKGRPTLIFRTHSKDRGIVLSYQLPGETCDVLAHLGREIKTIIPGLYLTPQSVMNLEIFKVKGKEITAATGYRPTIADLTQLIEENSAELEQTITGLHAVRYSFERFMFDTYSIVAAGIARSGYYEQVRRLYRALDDKDVFRKHIAGQNSGAGIATTDEDVIAAYLKNFPGENAQQWTKIARFTDTHPITPKQHQKIRTVYNDYLSFKDENGVNKLRGILLEQVQFSVFEFTREEYRITPIKTFKLINTTQD